MPEGHTIRRLADDCLDRFGGRAVRASSPQGPFAASAALIDGQELKETDAHGKHLFLGFPGAGWVHIHLGLYGKVAFGAAPPPPPVGAVRLRLVGDEHVMDLRGPTACELITPAEKQAIHDRLGPDPAGRFAQGIADCRRRRHQPSRARFARLDDDLARDQRAVHPCRIDASDQAASGEHRHREVTMLAQVLW